MLHRNCGCGANDAYGSNSEVAAIANHVCSTPTTDICALSEHFRFVPKPEVGRPYSITSSASASKVGGTTMPSALAVF
jgi:hypothetical protein